VYTHRTSTEAPGERVSRLLQVAIRASGVSQAEIERALGMSKGYLRQVFSGRIELKVRHVEVILGAIGLDPNTFYGIVYPAPAKRSRELAFEALSALESREAPSQAQLAQDDLLVAIREMVTRALDQADTKKAG